MIKTNGKTFRRPIEIVTEQIEIGESFTIDELFFEGNKDVLIPNSEHILSTIVDFMRVNSEWCYEVEGHINFPNRDSISRGSSMFLLSVARAKKVYKYLIDKDISPDRLRSRGYGNWEMKYPHTKDDNEMQMNRRVEIQILDCQDIKEIHSDVLPEGLDFSAGDYHNQ